MAAGDAERRYVVGSGWRTVAVSASGTVTAGDVDSDGAANGEVLTADGAGAATWEAGGGGSLPAWWTVDSTPGGEMLTLAGVIDIEGAADLGWALRTTDKQIRFLQGDGGLIYSADGSLELDDPVTGDPLLQIGPTGAVTISPTDAVVALTIDSAGGATAALEADALPITGVADPTNAQDVATKNYADTTFALIAAGVPDASGASSGDVLTADGAGGYAWVAP